MGEVYLACTHGIEGAERPCVVKTIRRDHATDRSFLARFFDEARVQAQLQHPGVAQILEASTDESGEPYVVVEYVEGRSLSEVRNRAVQLGVRIGWSDAVALMSAAAEALAHVHERTDASGGPLGIVHRDLSPQNVMVGYAGDLKLIDFGTARAQNRRCRTISGVVFAKPGYVAPEVANGDPGDFRVDLYALGVMLWELLAGRRFLQGEPSTHLALVAKGELSPPPLATVIGAPAALDGIIGRLVAHERDARYASTRVAAADLVRLLATAASLPNGERGVRARIAQLMYRLYPSEPAKSRAELGALMKVARWAEAESGQRRDANAAAAKSSAAPLRPSVPALPEIQGDRGGEEREGEEPNLLPGTRYRLLRLIGRGAMGEVYEAEHADLLRRVAIKVLAPEHALSPSYTASFRREARAIARLQHPNVVLLHEFGQTSDGRLFCAMERLEGQTLERRLEIERVLDWRDAVDIAIQICRGLSAAHAAGVVHRDLKPANIFLCADERGGRVKLLDFGIARTTVHPGGLAGSAAIGASGAGDDAAVSAPSGGSSQPGEVASSNGTGEVGHSNGAGDASDASSDLVVLGTPEYMAPEQLRSAKVDPRADLYAVGCVLYEMCTGRLPYLGRSALGILEQKLNTAPEPMRERARARRLPPKLDKLVQKALAPRPEGRFASAEDLREALEDVLDAPSRRRAGFRAVGYTGVAAALALAAAIGISRAKHWSWLAPPLTAGEKEARGGDPWEPPFGAAETGTEPAEVPAPAVVEPVEGRMPAAVEPAPSAAPPRRSSPALSPSPSRVPSPSRPLAPSSTSSPARSLASAPLLVAPPAPPLPTWTSLSPPSVVSVQTMSSSVSPGSPSVAAPMPRARRARKGTRETVGPLAELREEARQHRGDPAAARRWTQAALRAKDWDEASRAAQVWRSVDAGPEPAIALARALANQGRTDDAIALLDELLEAHPAYDEARALLADFGRAAPSSTSAPGSKGGAAVPGIAREDRAP